MTNVEWDEHLLLEKDINKAFQEWYDKDGWMFCGTTRARTAADLAFITAYKVGYRQGKGEK